MTAIVAFKRNGKVFLAGDRMGSNGYTKQVVSAPKIFSVGEDLHFGYTHSFYMGQLLQHMFIPPTKDHRDTDDRHLFTKIVPALKKMFDENDFGKKKDDTDNEPDYGQFLMVYKDRIFVFQGNSSVLEYDFAGVGCGGDDVVTSINTALDLLDDNAGDEDIEFVIERAFYHSSIIYTGVSSEHDVIIIGGKNA